MKIAKFELIDGSYFYKELVGENTGLLTELLVSDVGSYGESFIEFINDPGHQETIRNYGCIMKEGDDVLIGCQFDEDPYADCLRMTQREFVSIIDQWDSLIRQRPQEIIVFKEGESYRLEGHGFPGKQ